MVLEEWVPPGEDGADEAVLDEMDALAAQAPLPDTIQEEEEEEEENEALAEGVAGGDASAEGGAEGDSEGARELPDYEELLPPAPSKEGSDAAAAAATGLNGDAAVGAVAVEPAPAAGSDVPAEETKGSPVPA